MKIGADELPAVTQLFTEPYMVDFLLHNSLGAWWVTRHPGKACPVPLTYLRTLEDGTPAAGKFEGWPNELSEFKLLDPCCGSGHFLVAAFLLLVPMRMAAEGLSAMDAVDAVLADNLHGLELDARCVEIAVFALALAAWRFPDENGDPLGVRADMPAPQVACCGLKVAAKPEDWMALVPDDAANAAYLRQELRLLHASFAQAPLLGSLLDPARSLKNDLATSSFDTLRDLLQRALATERPVTLWGQASELLDDSWDLALTAKGLLDAARLLDRRYHLTVTNVPFLGQIGQSQQLRDWCLRFFQDAKGDLSFVFLLRLLELCDASATCCVVMPQGWLFQTSEEAFRERLLTEHQWKLIVRLGRDSFDYPVGADILLGVFSRAKPTAESRFAAITASNSKGAAAKATAIRENPILNLYQAEQLKNKNKTVILEAPSLSEKDSLGDYVEVIRGLSTGETNRFYRLFWELPRKDSAWEFLRDTTEQTSDFSGMSYVILWEDENGELASLAESLKHLNHAVQSWRRGKPYWGRQGVAINRMASLAATRYLGERFTDNVGIVVPRRIEDLGPIFHFCASASFKSAVAKVNPKLAVEPRYFASVKFDFEYWKAEFRRKHPDGLPKPYSDDPTQWLFHGHPQPATDPLQVAVARLAGYRWPAETDTAIELADEARTWIAHCEKLAEQTDDDGIVCLPSVRGESPAHDRLLKLLIAAWETVQPGSWKPAVLDKLLADAECAGKGLDVWLREKFFEQHAKRFHHRPFIWHVWDGLKDGFAALVNYHHLDHKKLERLIHTYLGDWIRQQEAGVRSGVDGAPTRLAAAQDLKRRLELILEGEPPYDIFVRWKKLSEQPIGWNPDLNDGVRLNIRPFMTAEVLRHNKKPKLNITWDKDRGKDVESAPWFKVFKGDRINDHHLTRAEKQAARAKADGS